MQKSNKRPKSPKQAIAIGLSKARKAGFKLVKKAAKNVSAKKSKPRSLTAKSRNSKSRSSKSFLAHA